MYYKRGCVIIFIILNGTNFTSILTESVVWVLWYYDIILTGCGLWVLFLGQLKLLYYLFISFSGRLVSTFVCPFFLSSGVGNHRYFIGYLFFLMLMILWCLFGCHQCKYNKSVVVLRGSHGSLKTWKVVEFENLDSRPGKSWNFCRGPWKSWNLDI